MLDARPGAARRGRATSCSDGARVSFVGTLAAHGGALRGLIGGTAAVRSASRSSLRAGAGGERGRRREELADAPATGRRSRVATLRPWLARPWPSRLGRSPPARATRPAAAVRRGSANGSTRPTPRRAVSSILSRPLRLAPSASVGDSSIGQRRRSSSGRSGRPTLEHARARPSAAWLPLRVPLTSPLPTTRTRPRSRTRASASRCSPDGGGRGPPDDPSAAPRPHARSSAGALRRPHVAQRSAPDAAAAAAAGTRAFVAASAGHDCVRRCNEHAPEARCACCRTASSATRSTERCCATSS